MRREKPMKPALVTEDKFAAEPVEMEDLDSADTCHDCGAWINPMLYPCNERTCPVRKRHTDFGR